MNAICFACGEPKSGPLEVCVKCLEKPKNRDDRINSYCLSLECLKPHHLEKATKYIRKTGTLPKFHPTVEQKAERIVEELLEFSLTITEDDSVEFSSSFFEMDSDDGVDPIGDTILVHAVGKPQQLEIGQPLPRSNGKVKTYHTMEWVVGQDISMADAETNLLDGKVLFIWYRWLGDKWAWKCVPPEVFSELRRAEE